MRRVAHAPWSQARRHASTAGRAIAPWHPARRKISVPIGKSVIRTVTGRHACQPLSREPGAQTIAISGLRARLEARRGPGNGSERCPKQGEKTCLLTRGRAQLPAGRQLSSTHAAPWTPVLPIDPKAGLWALLPSAHAAQLPGRFKPSMSRCISIEL